jgi:hypothetical protein
MDKLLYETQPHNLFILCYSEMNEKSSVLVRVADPDHFDAGLSLSFRFDADRDPFTLFLCGSESESASCTLPGTSFTKP